MAAPLSLAASPRSLYSHARAVTPPPLSSFIASRLVQPTTHPFGQVGSSSGGSAASPNDHWHSCVTKLGVTRSGSPSSLKSSCAGILHELRHMPCTTVETRSRVCRKSESEREREQPRERREQPHCGQCHVCDDHVRTAARGRPLSPILDGEGGAAWTAGREQQQGAAGERLSSCGGGAARLARRVL